MKQNLPERGHWANRLREWEGQEREGPLPSPSGWERLDASLQSGQSKQGKWWAWWVLLLLLTGGSGFVFYQLGIAASRPKHEIAEQLPTPLATTATSPPLGDLEEAKVSSFRTAPAFSSSRTLATNSMLGDGAETTPVTPLPQSSPVHPNTPAMSLPLGDSGGAKVNSSHTAAASSSFGTPATNSTLDDGAETTLVTPLTQSSSVHPDTPAASPPLGDLGGAPASSSRTTLQSSLPVLPARETAIRMLPVSFLRPLTVGNAQVMSLTSPPQPNLPKQIRKPAPSISLALGPQLSISQPKVNVQFPEGTFRSLSKMERNNTALGLNVHARRGQHWGLQLGISSGQFESTHLFRSQHIYNPNNERSEPDGGGVATYRLEMSASQVKVASEIEINRPSTLEANIPVRIILETRLIERVRTTTVPLQLTYDYPVSRLLRIRLGAGLAWNQQRVSADLDMRLVRRNDFNLRRNRRLSQDQLLQDQFWTGQFSGGLYLSPVPHLEIGIQPNWSTNLGNVAADESINADIQSFNWQANIFYRF